VNSAALPRSSGHRSTRRRGLVTRRALLAAGVGVSAVALLTSRRSAGTAPSERAISFGFEDVVTDQPRWEEYARRLHEVRATTVSLSVGRVDWAAFPWTRYPKESSSVVRATGRDYVAEALAALEQGPGGRRTVTLTIDALAPRLIGTMPELAGTDSTGGREELFASVSALESGEVGRRIVAMTAEICGRYRPDRVALTELLFDSHTFGPQDLQSYQRAARRRDWPRTAAGEIDTEHPSIGRWRSRAIASLLDRVSAVAAGYGVAVDMDVRAPWHNPAGDRPLSGHDYEILLTSCDRLTMWNYFGLNGVDPAYGAEVVRSLATRFPERFVMSTGLWGQGDAPVSAEDLARSLAAVQEAGAGAVSVTPASLMTDAHWAAVARQWA
jgi:hypothetical protein